ncbi:hypothetical protein FB566_3594 [Stackebrandtia endophytica]|uniref:Uncharacterized protein n=1 Tax=Stackebrandtia endophytica TaxID=1496996 RepID=A0A543AZM3_9ACTN|nr:hypothetical protein FB566_3594 [Stackebrandtia endophytica]
MPHLASWHARIRCPKRQPCTLTRAGDPLRGLSIEGKPFVRMIA